MESAFMEWVVTATVSNGCPYTWSSRTSIGAECTIKLHDSPAAAAIFEEPLGGGGCEAPDMAEESDETKELDGQSITAMQAPCAPTSTHSLGSTVLPSPPGISTVCPALRRANSGPGGIPKGFMV